MQIAHELESALAETEAWIDEFMHQLHWQNRNLAYDAFIGALHALRDSFPWDEAVQVGAYFPPLLRGLYYEGWHPTAQSLPLSGAKQFLDRIHDSVHREPGVDPEAVARGLFALLAKRLPASELEDARAVAPEALHALWPV
jgi:uncharacterized protein (DUF2267 family)